MNSTFQSRLLPRFPALSGVFKLLAHRTSFACGLVLPYLRHLRRLLGCLTAKNLLSFRGSPRSTWAFCDESNAQLAQAVRRFLLVTGRTRRASDHARNRGRRRPEAGR